MYLYYLFLKLNLINNTIEDKEKYRIPILYFSSIVLLINIILDPFYLDFLKGHLIKIQTQTMKQKRLLLYIQKFLE